MELFVLPFYFAVAVLAVVGMKSLIDGIRRKDKKKIREAMLFLFVPAIVFGFMAIPFLIVLFTGDLM